MFDVKTVWGTLQQYMGNSLFVVALFAAVCVCINKVNEKRKKELSVILLLLFVFVYNDFIKKILGKLTSDSTYYRFFWMIPVVLLIAYVVTEQLFSAKHWIDVVAICIAFVVFFQAVGTNVFQKEALQIPENKYNLSEDILEICAVIEQKKEIERPVVAFDSHVQLESRVYDPSILWAVKRDAYFHMEQKKYAKQKFLIETIDQGKQEKPEKLNRILTKLKVDYLVIQTAYNMDAYLQKAKCMVAGRTTNYTVYAYNGENMKK